MIKELNTQLEQARPSIDIDLITARVQQITIEDDYSRSNIRKHIYKYIEEKVNKKFKKKFKICIKQIDKYRGKKYYKSKDQRLIHIMAMTSHDIAIELFAAVLMEEREMPIQTAADKLAKHFNYENVFDGIKTAAEIITVCAKADLYDLYPNPMTLEVLTRLPKKIRRYIEQTRYLNPMVCKPNDWTNNRDGGYISVCQSAILGRHHHHEKKQALDAMNILQSIEWELDEFVLTQEEKSNKALDTKDKQDAFKVLKRTSRHVYDELLAQGNSFHFVWRPDFRGRLYSQGYYVNLQSTKYKKALLNFKHKELITG